MAATRAEVARLAGVSPSTVTYVLTGARPTSAKTQERVRAAVEQLGYQPNVMASSLASRRVRSVGVLLRMERAAVEAGDLRYIDGIRGRLEGAGIQVVVPMNLRAHPEENLRSLIRSQAIDSAILMDVSVGDEREAMLLEERVPTILIGTSGRQGGAPSIDADFDDMLRLGVKHLVALGHRKILGVMRRLTVENARAYRAQREGLHAAMAAYGVELVARHLPDNASLGGDLITSEGLIEGCTAVIGNNPAVLSGIQAAAKALGLSVPEDFSMLSIAGDAIAGDAAQLTEAGVYAEGMGARAGDMLLRLLHNPTLNEHILVPAEVWDRGSTGPVRSRAA